ncbi:MAG: lytic transglycosylase domain-containing protein [bacterium]
MTAIGLGWCGGHYIWLLDLKREDPAGGAAIDAVVERITGIQSDGAAIDAVVERIIGIESDGDSNATNKRSTAMGLGQFLDETWLDLMRTHRPDVARGRSKDETLELRRGAKLAREITMRFTEQNAEMLRKRGLPVTPGTLYLAHFAGGAGAVAILSALDDADAASVMASADATGRTKREKIVKANSFLERFTVVDLRSWANRKMRLPGS